MWYKLSVTKINQYVDLDAFQPAEKTDITFTRYQKYDGIEELKSKTFGKSVLFKNACHIHNKSTITLNMQSYDGSLFQFLSCSCLVNSYKLTAVNVILMTTSQTGKHQAIIQ